MFFLKRIYLIFLITLLVSLSSLVLPVVAGLPPRPTPIPPTVEKTSVPPQGGFISLTAVSDAPTTSLWTTVQWQDAQKNWHDVEGWRGSFDQENNVTWWVAPADLGKGPFRWLAHETEDSPTVIAISDTFTLPTMVQQTTAVSITLTIP